MSPAGCSHVNGYKVDNWKQNLRVIYQCFVWSGTAETRRRKVKTITVSHCVKQKAGHLDEAHSYIFSKHDVPVQTVTEGVEQNYGLNETVLISCSNKLSC